MAVLAVAAFAAGVLLAMRPGHEERQMVTRYVTAWHHKDYAQMYTLLDRVSKGQMSESRFARAVEIAADTSTEESLRAVHVAGRSGNDIAVSTVVVTKLWGTLHETLEVPLTGSGSGARVHFSDSLLFPGLRAGERLRRIISLPPRGTLLASDGTPWPRGPIAARPSPTWPTRSWAGWARSLPTSRPPTSRGATPPTPRSAWTASSSSSRTASPARPAAG